MFPRKFDIIVILKFSASGKVVPCCHFIGLIYLSSLLIYAINLYNIDYYALNVCKSFSCYIKIGIKHLCFPMYCIRMRNSSTMTTLDSQTIHIHKREITGPVIGWPIPPDVIIQLYLCWTAQQLLDFLSIPCCQLPR